MMSVECKTALLSSFITHHSSFRISLAKLSMTKRIGFPRELLLVEVERWCGDPLCNARTRLALTKEEARAYTGFECAACGRRNADALNERDIPDWWEELKVASLEGLRPFAAEREATGEVVARMSDAWHEVAAHAEEEATHSEEEEAEDSF
jgi:hypothetical protein